MKRILFVGFSVTIQTNGYFNTLKNSLKDKLHIDYYAIGGANLHAILYLLNDISFDMYDAVVFEVSTSVRWLKNDYLRYQNIFDVIIGYVLAKTDLIGCLDLSRLDVNRGDDALHQAIKDVCCSREIPCHSWQGPLEDFVYDGIHPNAKGVSNYAQLAENLIHETLNWKKKPLRQDRDLLFFQEYNPFLMSVDNLRIEGLYDIDHFTKGGVDKKCVVVNSGDVVRLHLNNKYYVNGMLLRIGPTSSRMLVKSNLGEELNRLPYDERNYYYRFLPLFFRMDSASFLDIQSIHENSRPKLLKGEESMERQEISIAGLFLSNKKLPF